VRAQQLTAIGAGLLRLTDGVERHTSTGSPRQVIVEMTEGVLLAAPIAPQMHLALLASSGCDREQLDYELGRRRSATGTR
jgi:predicted regulator of Ras-like GTPase activity (Roadblock/LC7/MglB family)